MTNAQQSRQQEALKKASVLAEALPWLIKFQESVVVIKFGGNAMTNPMLSKQFAEDVVFLKLAGLKPIVVHGGGPQISKKLDEAGIKSEFKSGYRVTTEQSIQIVRDVLVNDIQKELIAKINENAKLGVGMSGDENSLLLVEKFYVDNGNEKIDIGLVGDVKKVDVKQIIDVLESGQIPVISTLGVGIDQKTYNVNADTAAAAIASAIKAQKIVILTDVVGLMEKYPDEKSLIATIDLNSLRKLMPSLDEGMKPKMQACLDAITSGVSRAHVIDGREAHALLVEVFTDSGTGTMVIESMDKE
jgi:acetylglutamate kinase